MIANTAYETEEIRKCSEDYEYFMLKYCKLQHPVKGNVGFDIYFDQGVISMKPHLREWLRQIHTGNFNVAVMCRQSGKTSCMVAYALWTALFKNDVTVAYGCKTGADAMDVMSRIRRMFDCLPSYLQPKLKVRNTNQISFDNGSRIHSRPIAEDIGRGWSINLLILDDAAFVRSRVLEDACTSIYPAMTTGGKTVIMSTISDKSHYFTKLTSSELFSHTSVTWQDIGMPSEFKTESLKWMTPEKFAAEFENVPYV